jgi:para-nitrobenzyl esterase
MLNDDPIASTTAGQVRGLCSAGVARYLGVPYAAAPFGRWRFYRPQPVPSWSGIRPATAYGPTAPKAQYAPAARALFPDPTIPGDDCLNLNVWTPENAASAPVMVWVHGGSFQMGSNAVAEYDGTAFARDGVVCVSVNYRLGAEGFLELEDAPANRGLLDIVAALRWVQANISGFGGDPARVTLVGQSAGAMAVGALLAMPAAEGLFAAAVMQSGADANVLTRAQAERAALAVAVVLGTTPTREAMASIEPERIVDAVTQITAAVRTARDEWGEVALRLLPFGPVVDGRELPEHPLTGGGGAAVPLLIGTTRDEFRLFVPPDSGDGLDWGVLEAAAEVYGLPADGLGAYRSDPDQTPRDVLANVITDWFYRLPAIELAGVREAAGAATWMYRFDGLDRADNGGLGAAHGTDLPFSFDTISYPGLTTRIGPSPSPEVARTAHGALVRFITEHDPGWGQYRRATRKTALLGRGMDEVDDPGGDERRAWD